jgi:hypothetical protein
LCFWHSYQTRPGDWPGQGVGSRVSWVNSGQPGSTRINLKKIKNFIFHMKKN